MGVTGEPRPDARALGQAPDEMQGIWAWPAASEVTQQRQLSSPTWSPSLSQVCFSGGQGSWLISVVKELELRRVNSLIQIHERRSIAGVRSLASGSWAEAPAPTRLSVSEMEILGVVSSNSVFVDEC